MILLSSVWDKAKANIWGFFVFFFATAVNVLVDGRFLVLWTGKAWADDNWEATSSFYQLCVSFAVSCLSVSNLQLAFLINEFQLSWSLRTPAAMTVDSCLCKLSLQLFLVTHYMTSTSSMIAKFLLLEHWGRLLRAHTSLPVPPLQHGQPSTNGPEVLWYSPFLPVVSKQILELIEHCFPPPPPY